MTRYANRADLARSVSPDVAALNRAALTGDDAAPAPAPAPAYRLTEAKPAHQASPTATEHEEQAALFAWADATQTQRPELAMLFAIPNGGARHPAVGAMLKGEGVRAGYPDIALDVARGRWHGLRIEMKRADHSNHATPEQLTWLERLRQYGYMAVVCYGCTEAVDVIVAYLQQEARP